MLDPRVWGRGYATEAGAASLGHAFGALGCQRVVSIVHPENEPSLRVAARLSLAPWREVEWDDTGVMLQVRAIRRQEWSRLQSEG